MQIIGGPENAEAKVLSDMRAIISTVRWLSAQDIESINLGIVKLRTIRSAIYEHLNQVQHEYLILRGLRWLLENGFGSEITWEWNPRQTGTANEPDLRGSLNGRVLVSAEASASENPVGKIDARMKQTLEKLGQMEGQKFYFACTDVMTNRARTKVSKGNLPITVVLV